MKKFLPLFLLVLLAIPLTIQASVLTFTSQGGEPFQVKLNGVVVNHRASTFVYIPDLHPGRYYVEFRVMGRKGIHHLRTQLMVPIGVESSYALHIAHKRGNVRLRMIGERLLLPLPVVVMPPPSRPQYPNSWYEPISPRYEKESNYCRNILSREDVDRLANAIENRSFESTKLTIAREVIRSGSILAEDLNFLLEQFSYESSKLDLAKFAYDHVCDRERYYYVYEAFKFDSSIRELEEYISNRR